MTTLTAVVPATNSPATLHRCLEALAGSSEPADEVIVVSRPSLAGPAAARNSGAARATGDVIVFVDADVLVARDALARVRSHFAADAELAAVFGSYDAVVATKRLTAHFRNLLHHHVHHRSPGRATTFWAGLGAVRRSAFTAVGGFDEQQFPAPSVEDIEFGLRLSDAGGKIELDPAIQGTHLKDWSLRQMISTDFRRRGLPWVALLLARGRASTALNLGWRDRLSAACAVLAAVATVSRRPTRAFGAVAGLVLLNSGLYGLLARRLGVVQAVACVPLHILHHLAAAAAVPAGIVAHVRRRGPRT